MRFQFIEDHRSEFRLEKMCKVMCVSRSGYYKWRTDEQSNREQHRLKLTERVKWHYYDSNKIYGSPRIAKELWKEGWKVSERTVGKIMCELGLRSLASKVEKMSAHKDTLVEWFHAVK